MLVKNNKKTMLVLLLIKIHKLKKKITTKNTVDVVQFFFSFVCFFSLSFRCTHCICHPQQKPNNKTLLGKTSVLQLEIFYFVVFLFAVVLFTCSLYAFFFFLLLLSLTQLIFDIRIDLWDYPFFSLVQTKQLCCNFLFSLSSLPLRFSLCSVLFIAISTLFAETKN